MAETTPEHKARVASERRDHRWQKSMSPWLLTFISVLAAFFLVASFLQFRGLAEHTAPDQTLTTADTMEWAREAAKADTGSDPAVLQTLILASMATDTTAQRYGLAKVGLMTAVWLRYLGFLTGMIMALMGAAFLWGRVKDADGGTEIEGESTLWKGSIRTASPGLLLAAMGTLLMITAMLNSFEVAVEDGGLPTVAEAASPTTLGSKPGPFDSGELDELEQASEADTLKSMNELAAEALDESR